MTLLRDLFEMKNHMGETVYNTYSGWRAACKKKAAGKEVKWTGDKDIGECHVDGHAIGEWDGEKGSVFN